MHTDAEEVVAGRRLVARFAVQVSRVLADKAGPELVSTPGLDMLLDLYLAEPGAPVCLTGLSGAAITPSRTSLSVIARLVDHGLLIRAPDPNDGRRVLVHLSDKARSTLDECLDALLTLMP